MNAFVNDSFHIEALDGLHTAIAWNTDGCCRRWYLLPVFQIVPYAVLFSFSCAKVHYFCQTSPFFSVKMKSMSEKGPTLFMLGIVISVRTEHRTESLHRR